MAQSCTSFIRQLDKRDISDNSFRDRKDWLEIVIYLRLFLAMRHTLPQNPEFYVTAPQDCPYLDNQVERNSLQPYMELTLNALIILYQSKALGDHKMYCIGRLVQTAPLVCQQEFQVESSNLQSHKRNYFKKLRYCRVVNPPLATDAQYDLFKQYITARHPNGGMSDMDADDFTAMIEETNVESKLIEYYGKNGS